MSVSWEPVIGLEIHVHLKTRTKMFCRCEVAYFDPPNTHTCPVCLALPGALPVPNRQAVEWTILLGLALGCRDRRSGRSSTARTTSTPTTRRATRSPSTTSRSAWTASFEVPGADGDRVDRDRARAPRGGRRQDDPRRRRRGPHPRRRALARRLQPLGHAAGRDRDQARHPLARGGEARSCSCCGRRSSSSGSRTRRWRRARCGSTSTSRCGRRAPTSCARGPS